MSGLERALWSEQLAGFTLVELPLPEAARAMERALARFGPVSTIPLVGIKGVIDYLSPLTTFTTRHAAIALEGWTALLTDMRGENCHVDGFALSRATSCRALGVTLCDERREMYVYEEGHLVREVLSLLDGSDWYFREVGTALPFESEPRSRRKDQRLSLASLQQYMASFTGMAPPVWRLQRQNPAIGLSRTVVDVRVSIRRFSTIDDVSTPD
jgi:hypothetical protein